MNGDFSDVFDSDVNCKKKRTKRIPHLIYLPVILAHTMTKALAQDNPAAISDVVTDPNCGVVVAQAFSTHTQNRETPRTVTDSPEIGRNVGGVTRTATDFNGRLPKSLRFAASRSTLNKTI
jgi:hypothetical protein